MKYGDLFLIKGFPNEIVICGLLAASPQGFHRLYSLTNATGNINPNPYEFTDVKDSDIQQFFTSIAWNGPEYKAIIGANPVPYWVHNVVAGLPITTVSTPSNANPVTDQTYPIGTMFLGTGKQGNVWIVNTNDSRKISLLFDGKNCLWAFDEFVLSDNLASGSHNAVSMDEVLKFIEQKHGKSYAANGIPEWAANMRRQASASNLWANTPIKSNITLNPGAVKSLKALGIIKEHMAQMPNIKVDSPQDKCNHRFKSYVGFREVYDYCIHCDLKVNKKH